MSPEQGSPGRGLSAKLLGLTLAFIMVAEVLVFLPSLGRALQVYGEQVIIELERGALDFEVLGPGDTEERTIGGNFTQQQAQALQMQLLDEADWIAFAARLPGNRSILTGPPPAEDRWVRLDQGGALGFMWPALQITYDFGPPKVVRLSGQTRDGMSQVDIWLDDQPLRDVLRGYAVRIFFISLGISIFAAALVYLSLRRLIVRPIEKLRMALAKFAERPGDPGSLLQPSNRKDEIGFIEGETRAMQDTIAATLQQKERLAALGSAVAQVNHDLRGMLSTALLLSDSLESSDDPRVAKAAPVLANSIERAVELCSATLKFAKGGETAVDPQPGNLAELIQSLTTEWRLRWPKIKISTKGPKDQQALFDATALTRVLDNLARNAVEAGSPAVQIHWQQADDKVMLDFRDQGPGIPAKAQADLFVPFKGSTKRDGTGLGVANASELAQAMGGSLMLEETGPEGTTFALHLALPA